MIDEKKVQEELDKIRPYLQMEGGDVEFVEIQDETIKVRLKGMCAGCPMSSMTLKYGIERRLKEAIPEIKAVETV